MGSVQIIQFLNPLQISVQGQINFSCPQELLSEQLGWVRLNLIYQYAN